MALVKIGSDLQLFSRLSKSDDSVTLEDLVVKTHAAPKMLSHILRAMAAFGLISETTINTFKSNKLTRTLASEHVAGAIAHVYDCHGPTAREFPAWLAENKYSDVITNTNLPLQRAMETDLTPFEWLKSQPEQMNALGHAMAVQRDEIWLNSFPLATELDSFTATSESVLLVDIGGGFGQQATAFRARVPKLKGRVVVQDLYETLSFAPQVEGIEYYEHGFFKEQSIAGAKFYYLRHILYDWNDGVCRKILEAIVPALGSDSRIIIDEVVLPKAKLPWQVAYMDFTMITCLGGMERTRTKYENLLDSAGLKVLDLHRYDAKLPSVIVAASK